MNSNYYGLRPIALGVLTVLTFAPLAAQASGPVAGGSAVSSAGNSEAALENQQQSLGGGTGAIVEYGHLKPEATPDPSTGQIPPPGLIRIAPPDPAPAASPVDSATPAPANLLTDRTAAPLAREIRAAGEDAPPKEAADWGKPLAILAALAGLVVLGVRLWGQRLDAELQGRGIHLDD